MTNSRSYDRYEMAINALPEAKRDAVREIQENYWLTSDALTEKYDRKRTAAFLEEYKRLNVERKAQFAKILTPEEMEEYEIGKSSTGNSLTNQMREFNPTEQEFRDVYRIRKQIDEPFEGALSARSVNSQDAQSAADRQKQSGELIKQVLGDQRA